MVERGFIPHVRSRGEEKLEKMTDGRKARRWVVEVYPRLTSKGREGIILTYLPTLTT